MKSIIQFSVKNRFALWLLTLIIAAAGLFAGTSMKMETLPNITTPIVSVTTVYPGAAPEQVLQDVSRELEAKVRNLPGVDSVQSSSYQNFSSIQIGYAFRTDMKDAEQRVQEAVAGMSFPEGVQKPEVSRLSFDSVPIAAFSVRGNDEKLPELTKLVEEELQPEIEGIDGVQTVQVSGQEVRRVEIKFDDAKLKRYGLTKDTVSQFIQAGNAKMALGLYELGKSEQSIVMDGESRSLADLKNMRIPYTPGAVPAPAAAPASAPMAPRAPGAAKAPMNMSQAMPGGALPQAMQAPLAVPTIPLSAIASVADRGKEDSISRTNGKQSIGVQVTKSQDANTVNVVNALKEQLASFQKAHPSVKAEMTLDQGKPIEDSVSTMIDKALVGAAFAILIILLFLRNVRSTLIAVISIPLSLLIAVLLLKQLDISLNIMTLGAMTVAIGRVVDDSIVVIENIYRRMSASGEMLHGKELIVEATREMFVPIASSTIVTIAVFLPMGLVSGFVGELFLPFAITIVFALLASLLVAITIVPMMADWLFNRGTGRALRSHEAEGGLSRGYKRILNWSLRHKLLVFSAAVLLLLGSFLLVPVIGVSFLNQGEEKTMFATFKAAPGTTLEETLDAAKIGETYFMDDGKVEQVQFSVGGENPFGRGSAKDGVFIVRYKSDTEDFADKKVASLKQLNKKTTGGEWKEQSFGGGGATSDLSYKVYADSIEDLQKIAPKFTAAAKAETDYVRQASSDLKDSYVEYSFRVDQKKAAASGLTTAQLAMAIANVRAEEQPLTQVKVDGKMLDVVIPNEEKTYASISDIKSTLVQTPLGARPLSDFASIRKGTTPATLTEEDGKLVATITAELKTNKATEAAQAVEKRLKEIALPSGVKYAAGGVTEQINESFQQLGLAMAAAIAIVYFVLVLTFGGAVTPLVILFSLPFAIIGGLFALLLAGEPISVSALIGALMLIGIVVTNAIILVDRALHKEREGLTPREALLEAGGTRVRPILMTAFATIGALLPLAFGLEGGGLISKGLAVTVIGGLASSTLLTLVIVPIVYEFFAKFRARRRWSDSVKQSS